jgi:hypothetical protein
VTTKLAALHITRIVTMASAVAVVASWTLPEDHCYLSVDSNSSPPVYDLKMES